MADGASDVDLDQAPNAIAWVRKRDGSVVAFDPAKVASSIYLARERLDAKDAAFHAQELAQAVLHFLAKDFEAQVPTTVEVSDSVVKFLREMGQGPTAELYHDYRERRHEARRRIRVLEDDGSAADSRAPGAEPRDLESEREIAPGPDGAGVESWDKARIVWTLQTEADLEPTIAREVAAAVERKLLACDLGRVPTGLIRELVDCELLERGLVRPLGRRRFLGVPAREIERLLAEPGDPDRTHALAGRELLRQYALQEVYSRDIAGLHQEGLLHLFDAECPAHWAAVSLDAMAIAARSRDDDSFLHELESELDRLCRRVERTITIDALDGVLALVADSETDQVAMAERVTEIFRRITRGRRVHLVVNLFGRAPDWVTEGMSDGPLFRIRTSELHDRAAHRFARHCAERIFEDPELSSSCRVDFHPDVHLEADEFRAVVRPWVRFFRKPGTLSVTFDRECVHLAEGLRWAPATRAAVHQYVGIRLPLLWHRLAHSADDETLARRLGMLCESAVRAGVQKREFLRRRQPDSFSDRRHDAASVVIVPIGLDALVTRMIGKSIGADEAATAFGEQLIARMLHRLRHEARHYQMPCLVDGVPVRPDEFLPADPYQACGPTPAAPGAGPRGQIAAGGKLHATASAGATECRFATEDEIDPEQLAELTTYAALQTRSCRLRFLFPTPAQQAKLADDWIE